MKEIYEELECEIVNFAVDDVLNGDDVLQNSTQI